MNTERYVWPVIIAASLHGALLLSFMEKNPPPLPGEVEVTPILPEKPRIEMTEPPEDSADSVGGAVESLPSQPDIPRPADPKDNFTVPVTPEVPSIKPVMKLPETPTGPIGPLSPGTDIGRPRIPGVDRLDRVPRAMVQPSPNYPDAMRHAGVTGSVTVEFVVDGTGRVLRAEAVRWTHVEFVDPAVRAVLRWRFEPGTINGRRVSFRMAVPIEFNAER